MTAENDRFTSFFVLLLILILGRSLHWCRTGHTRRRREKEEWARRRMGECKQGAATTTSDEKSEYRVYEICYNGSTRGRGDGYGHGELHLTIAKYPDGNGRREIFGCGMREFEFTEIIDGHIDSSGNAEWIEKITREIGYIPPHGSPSADPDLAFLQPFRIYGRRHHASEYLGSHSGLASIRSKGKFDANMQSFEGEYFGRDECKCHRCQVFWTRWSDRENANENGTFAPVQTLHGEPVTWCPASQRRKIGEYILFRLKGETAEQRNEIENKDQDVFHRMD